MSKANSNFEQLIEHWYYPVYRFCFLMTGKHDFAQSATFQTFLYLGAGKSFSSESEEIRTVFRAAKDTCDDFFFRSARKFSRTEEMSAEVWKFLHLPQRQKIAKILCHNLGFPAEVAADVLKTSAANVSRLCKGQTLPAEAFSQIFPDTFFTETFYDDLLLRFEERSVGVENRLRRIRLFADRAIIWIALAIVLLFAAAAIYTSRL